MSTGLEVRAGDLVAQVEQHLGDAAHADAADADEVHVRRMARLEEAGRLLRGSRRHLAFFLPSRSRPRWAPRSAPSAPRTRPPAPWRPRGGPAARPSSPSARRLSGSSLRRADLRGQLLPGQLRLAEHERRAGVHQRLAFTSWWLSVAKGKGMRIAGLLAHRELGQRGGARAADDQLRPGVGVGHVLDELHHLGLVRSPCPRSPCAPSPGRSCPSGARSGAASLRSSRWSSASIIRWLMPRAPRLPPKTRTVKLLVRHARAQVVVHQLAADGVADELHLARGEEAARPPRRR